MKWPPPFLEGGARRRTVGDHAIAVRARRYGHWYDITNNHTSEYS